MRSSRRLTRNAHAAYTELTETEESIGEPCQDCGNIAGPVQPPVCPNCEFRDIGPCPVCGVLHSRQEYEEVRGDVCICPTRNNGTRHRVRLMFNDPLILPDGEVQPASGPRQGYRPTMTFDSQGHLQITPEQLFRFACNDPRRLIDHYLTHGTPAVFPTYDAYCDFLREISNRLEVHPKNLVLRGFQARVQHRAQSGQGVE